MKENKGFKFDRLPKDLQKSLNSIYGVNVSDDEYLSTNTIHQGDSKELLLKIKPNSVALSVWSPPYYVGKSYEKDLTFEDWKELLKTVINNHFPIIKPGGFLAINIADILVFKDPSMPRIQADVLHRKKLALTKEQIWTVLEKNPNMNKYDLAKHFGCSEQTIDRRLHGNNIRGGKHETQTRVKIVGGLIEEWALESGFYPYDRRVWVKYATCNNSRWVNLSYRSVDEFEYIYIFWKPGITRYDRNRLKKDEWKNWGSRAVWNFPSVRTNNDHEAKFPIELPTRIIKLLSAEKDLILDCFIGSGTTAISAIQENRNFIGIEIESSYVELSKARVLKETGINLE